MQIKINTTNKTIELENYSITILELKEILDTLKDNFNDYKVLLQPLYINPFPRQTNRTIYGPPVDHGYWSPEYIATLFKTTCEDGR